MYRVVVADDEFLEREFIKEAIRGIGNARVVGEGNSGIMAIELCLVLKPDLVFLNCGMGAVGGSEAASRIRQADKDVVIALTSADENNFRTRDDPETSLSSLGVAECLLKPISAEKIKEVVIKYGNLGKSGPRISPKMKKRLKFYPATIMSAEITRALSYIDAHYGEEVSLNTVADEVSLSSYYFSRLFKKEVGVNFSQYILHKRLEMAKRMLEETDDSITDISVSVGFQEHNYFGRIFKQFTGSTPSDYRKKLALQKEERVNLREKYL
jgi:YesN/AraC family two-component response regulator